MNDLDDLYGDEPEAARVTDNGTRPDVDSKMTETEVAGDDEGSEEESDSDVEFVITTKSGQRAEAPAAKAQPYAAIKIQKPGTTTTATPAAKKEPIAKLPDVDVDAIAEMDGKSILEIDLETLENKPWRQPGADITEYFNYGFDEFTWAAYCQKQTSLREDYTPNKVMQGMMGAMDPTMMGPMGGAMMMPPMDPNMMQQMYGGMPMDFMQGPGAGFPAPPMPQQNQYNRRQDGNSPMPDQYQREDSAASMANVPKGPAQSRGNYRPRGGGNRWQ
ncbi:Pre-mRNA polyadenylation factor fip1 [Taphrina deformans PYCC 5710]|uniref:Pre-mRNA polyadenylation factor fip1 n=1 Tax=Taphrina deformans (strain PYCC 5710 / ATCC 11124 / CBS 356.35 / IMI 108563 / JCM 9778 / NBRC 8474) TaxID=1097556 RepID=R4X7B4_TAPDE|nr:Pre-mRNA polyadenylation factor fip1 [Taphrina deformans PYCC 5710]|eukprot:CCG81227.1 Pre-mRNA polyadenylation factor fip1 [Taphrina deformans PYCC 5710]